MLATINDVAQEAGVSITTVSRVLNNNYPVKKQTREKIEKAIAKLNYRPNVMARSLITKKTSMIGVVVPGITNLFFPTIVEEIENFIKNKGYSISLCSTGGDSTTEKELVELIISRQVDGIIIIDPTVENIEKGYFDALSKNTPTIIVNGSAQGSNCNFVCYDEEVGTREVFEYLLGLEHKKIAFVRGHRSFSYDLKERIYNEIVEGKSLAYKKIINVGWGNSIEVVEKTQILLEEMFKQEELPTAVFACNDLMAVGVLNCCNKLGLKVPEDVSVIGFDNTLLSSISHPKLTTVDQNMREIGLKAAQELLDSIDNGMKNRKNSILDTRLVIRESSGKCKP